MARKFKKRRIKISSFFYSHKGSSADITMRYDFDLIYYKKGQHALECVTKGYSHIIRTDKSQPSSATPKKKRMKEQHLAMREDQKEQSGQKNHGCLKSSTPTGLSRTIRFVASCFAQTAIMDDCVIRQHGHHTTAHSHSTSQFLVAHNTVPLVGDDDVAIPAALPSGFTVA